MDSLVRLDRGVEIDDAFQLVSFARQSHAIAATTQPRLPGAPATKKTSRERDQMRHFAFTTAAAVALLIAGAVIPVYAEGPQDQAALAGLSEVKVAFDVRNGDPKGLLKELDVIDETRQSLIKQGVKPNMV